MTLSRVPARTRGGSITEGPSWLATDMGRGVQGPRRLVVSQVAGMVRGVDRARPTGGDLFIVDNSVSGWTGLEYLRQWSDLAESFDIATGFFEIGALLALDGKWQQLSGIRLLMGDEVSLRTKAAFRGSGCSGG